VKSGVLAYVECDWGPVNRALDAQLVSIYKNSMNYLPIGPLMPGARREWVQEFLKPIDSFDPAKRTLMTTQAGSLAPVNFTMLQRLTTVIAQAAAGNGSTKEDLFRDVTVGGQTFAGIMTIRQFMALTAQQQLAVIDVGWNRVCRKKAYDKLSREMFEPNKPEIAPTIDPVPSGVVPDGMGMKVGYFNEGRVPDAFTGLGVGFRVDGSGSNIGDTITRVTNQGMTTQLKNRHLMLNIKGWEVGGTTVDRDTNAPRIWSTKDDLFNESSVCISRNFYGATAFPLREMEDDALIWAVDVGGMIGFDTEAYQKLIGRHWRPGEKAYKFVNPSRVIGYARFTKLGAPGAGGWSFKIAPGTTWTLVGNWAGAANALAGSREAKVITYINDQLTAWAGADRTISGAFDFA
jgi:hypothetical protein